MLRIALFLLAAGIWLQPGQASEPGEPLDCSDWTILDPSYSCSIFVDCASSPGWERCLTEGSGDGVIAYDNGGRLLTIRRTVLGTCPDGWDQTRWELIWTSDGELWNTLARLDEQCTSEAGDHASMAGLYFDDKMGRLLLVMQQFNFGPADYNNSVGVEFRGFATTFDILQTYDPGGTISYRVPYMPEGFPAASYFDTYYGDLATVGDWTAAQPLQCGYPGTPPRHWGAEWG